MSMTKRYIEELTARAERGDDDARRSLEEAGLWGPDEGGDEYPYCDQGEPGDMGLS
jgi:hypothetical protein